MCSRVCIRQHNVTSQPARVLAHLVSDGFLTIELATLAVLCRDTTAPLTPLPTLVVADTAVASTSTAWNRQRRQRRLDQRPLIDGAADAVALVGVASAFAIGDTAALRQTMRCQ